MGNVNTKTKVVHRPDPNVLELLEEMKKERDELRKMHKDPAQFSANEGKLFEKFLKNITECEFKHVIIERINQMERHIAMLGNIGVGKSTTINSLAGRKVCAVGIGETTKFVKKVFQTEHYHFWDVPGNNKAHNYLDINNLSFLKALDKVYVLYDASPKDAERLIRVCATLKVNFTCIRTKCENIDEDDEKSVEVTIQEDQREIRGMEGISGDVPVFAISARNVKNKSGDFFDWEKLTLDIFSS